MGLIIRHAGFPYIDGEVLPGKDLETDIARAYAEIAGNMNNLNVRSTADIDGAKLKDGSLPGSKITDNVLTSAKIEADAVIGQKIEDNILETEVMAADSLTTSAQDDVTSPSSADDPGVTIATKTISTGSVAGLVLLCAVVLSSVPQPSSDAGLRMRITRDGTEIFDWDLAIAGANVSGASSPYSIFHIDNGYSLSSSVVYNLIGDLYSGSTTAVVLDDLIFVVAELRR